MDRIHALGRQVSDACRRAGTPLAVLTAVKEALQYHVPADRWCAMTLDPATALPTAGLHEQGFSPQRMPRLLELEFNSVDVNQLPDLARAREPVATLSEATHGDRDRSARYREVIAPDGLAHELRAVFRDGHGPWAGLILLRADDANDFDKDEVALVAGISEQVTRALRRTLLLGEIEARSSAETPALLLLEGSPTLSVCHASATAAHWLAQIEDGTVDRLPFPLYSLAQRARADGRAVTRLRTRAGRWLTAHAEALPDSGQVSVILQPSRPHEIAQVLTGAYALTRREAEVARLVAAGYSNPEIADLLCVSRYTVEDHLKHLYEKLEVKSRSELVSRLFFDQYLPRTQAGLGLDGTGWFMDRDFTASTTAVLTAGNAAPVRR
jgi:DNA-binding CsgD family transcriptional regulator